MSWENIAAVSVSHQRTHSLSYWAACASTHALPESCLAHPLSLQHLHFVPDLPTPLLIHSLTYPPHTHSLIHPLPHSATLLLPPSSNCACIYSLADFLIFQPLAHSDNSINLSSIPPHSLTHYSLTHTLSLSNPYTFAHALINDLVPSTMQSLTKQQHPVSFCAKPSRDLVGRGVKDAKLVFCREERKRRHE